MKLMRNMLKKLKKGKAGQAALEYALVIAVITAVIVGAAVAIFQDDGEDGLRQKVFQRAVDQVRTTMDGP